jgi:WD40 repeat protein
MWVGRIIDYESLYIHIYFLWFNVQICMLCMYVFASVFTYQRYSPHFICILISNQARIWDLRYLDSRHSLAELPHPRVVNAAYFSPVTGNKILTTCQDNRLRIYDCIFSDLAEPSREIVHSHDFNRYLTCFRAEWDPKVWDDKSFELNDCYHIQSNMAAIHYCFCYWWMEMKLPFFVRRTRRRIWLL